MSDFHWFRTFASQKIRRCLILLLSGLFFGLLVAQGQAIDAKPADAAPTNTNPTNTNLTGAGQTAAKQTNLKRPNVLFILVDDMGWADLSAYGSSLHETPNIDGLAKKGVRFTNAYAACPVCSPTRASLLTGKYPARLDITNWIDAGGFSHPLKGKLVDASYKYELPLSEKTLAETLKENGYATWHIGKWHLGNEGFYPTDQGFDVNIGGCYMGHPWNGYFSPYKIPTLPDGPKGEYLTDRLTAEAIQLIKNHADFNRAHPDEAQPFFMNCWFYTVHSPIQAKPEKIAYFQDKKKKLGLDKLSEDEIFTTEGTFRYLKKIGQPVKIRQKQTNAAYAAMVSHLDDSVGRLIQTLEETGDLDNTLIFFTSDNGGYSTAGGPTSNAPLKAGKAYLYEGGVREPLIVYWKGQIFGAKETDFPITSPDFYPTILELLGLPLNPQQHIDGQSFAGILHGENPTPAQKERPLFWHYAHYCSPGSKAPNGSVLKENWKLIEDFENHSLELYNLTDDPYETENVEQKFPEKREELLKLLQNWRQEVSARMPTVNPNWTD